MVAWKHLAPSEITIMAAPEYRDRTTAIDDVFALLHCSEQDVSSWPDQMGVVCTQHLLSALRLTCTATAVTCA